MEFSGDDAFGNPKMLPPTGKDVVADRRMLLLTARKTLGGDAAVGDP
jgi:hypothetical protein